MEITNDETKVIERIQNVWGEACARYVISDDEFPTFAIELLQNGSINRVTKKPTAALARMRGNTLSIVVNRLAVEQNVADYLQETVPHEVAHLVCFARPHLGNRHDEGWQRVCRALGGRADIKFTTGEMYDLRQRKRIRYVYATPAIGRFDVSDVQHARIQAGTTYLTKAKEVVTPMDWTGDIA